MSHNDVFIGLGSNLSDPEGQVRTALATLSKHPDIEGLLSSSLYSSKPVGPQDQPDFVNAVASFTTSLEALELLDLLQSIEQSHQRVRERHWGPRTLDLDLLFFQGQIINNDRLTVPHPYALERGFVLLPLAELAPDFILHSGRTASAQLSLLDTSDLAVI